MPKFLLVVIKSQKFFPLKVSHYTIGMDRQQVVGISIWTLYGIYYTENVAHAHAVDTRPSLPPSEGPGINEAKYKTKMKIS